MKKTIIIILGFILCAGCTKDFNPNFDKDFELAHKRWEREIKTNPPTEVIIKK